MNWLTLAQDGGADKGFDPKVIVDLIVDYGEPLMWAVIILILANIASKIANNFARNGLQRAKVDETVARFLGRMAQYTVLALGVVFALSKFGVDVTSVAAIFVAAGFAVGMALSGTLSSFAAGVMLLTFRPFKVGQVVNAAGVTAKVIEIELFSTTFDTPDNRRIIVPNSAIYGSTIENISYNAERRVDVGVGVDYSADIDATRAVLEKAAKSLTNIIEGEGRGTQVVLGDLGDSSVNWTVRAWVPASDFWPTKEALTRAVKMHLDEAGISIPFPQMDVHLDKPDA
jgi:small conductance mechanosensitive channel